MKYPHHLQKLIYTLKRLPGVGSKSAERYAFEMLSWTQAHHDDMASTISTIHKNLKQCPECGCLQDNDTCLYCREPRLSSGKLCLIASPKDAYAVEETGEYRGLYHVIGGLLSPLDNIGPEKLNINSLHTRLERLNVTEVIIALDSTLEGDATALFLKKELASLPLTVTRPAFGIPMGSSLDYVDGGTLARALASRAHF